MNNEQTERIDNEIKRLRNRRQESVTDQAKSFIDGMIHALQWAKSNL